MKTKLLRQCFFMVFTWVSILHAQQKEDQRGKPSSFGKMKLVRTVPSIAEQIRTGTFVPAASTGEMEAPPKRRHGNRNVPGKGSDIDDPAKQMTPPTRQGATLNFVFNADTTPQSIPTDPTGAVGPNHYLAAWNVGFRIFDKNGNPLMPEASLGTVLTGNTAGDPIVLYDPWADRYIITEFDGPDVFGDVNGFEMAISQGPDPINDGWYVYLNSFPTPEFPDYTKFSIWSDGYYVTANIIGGATNEGVWVVERDKIINGEQAQFVGFPLTGLQNFGFFSPQGFNVTNGELPPPGNFPVVYMQDDAWAGVSHDHLKMWNVNVDWTNLANSSISAPIELGAGDGISAFTSVFDGGSFANLDQPGNGDPDVDALQATIMNQAQYRRFCDYNSAVFNFVVDTEAGAGELAGIRWYELRQTADGQPWTVYQEGTYTVPGDVRHAFSASMAMDIYGNIGMAYTSVGSDAGEEISIRYTGRLAEDPLGTMTFAEGLIAQSIVNNPEERLADYVHLTVDPVDDATFWHIAEYFKPQRSDVVGVFKLENGDPNDAAVVSIDSPNTSTLTATEAVTITIENYGTNTLTSIPVSYSVNGAATVNETWSGSLAPGAQSQYTFTQTADLSAGGSFTIDAETNVEPDSQPQNDCMSKTVNNLQTIDVGVTVIVAPVNGTLGAVEAVTVTITNFGGQDQSNIPVSYTIDDGAAINETYAPTLAAGASVDYTFTQTADFSILNQTYVLQACTGLAGDGDATNDCTSADITHELDYCIPEAIIGCGVDGIKQFILGTITADDGGNGCNSTGSEQGYANRKNLATNLDRVAGNNAHLLQAQQNWDDGINVEVFSVWIDFDDSSTFEVSERLISGEFFTAADALTDFILNIPDDAALGLHTLRAKAIDGSAAGDILDPCSDFSYGEVHDYTVNIIDTSLNTPDPNLESMQLNIYSRENNHFNIELTTAFSDSISLYVYNSIGQIVVFNNLIKENGSYVYDLNMSYASKGVYFIKIGTEDNYEIGRILVK